MAELRQALRTVPLALTATLLLPLGLFALGACGGESASGTAGPVIDQAAVAEMDAGEFREMLTEASDRLIASHGGDEAAFIALFWALDRGYDPYQLLTGALNDRLEADGRITDAKGAELTPARRAEGIIRISGSTGGETGDGAAGSPEEPVLLACLPGTVAFADEWGLTEVQVVLLGRADLIMEFYDHFAGVPIRMAQLEREEYEQKRLAEEELKKRQAALAKETVTRMIAELAARGYSTEQLAKAAVLLETDPTWQREIDAYVWSCLHTSGETLRPAHEPITSGKEAVYPPVAEDAPADYDRAEVEAALDGGGSASTTTTTEAELTETPPMAEDIITSTVPGEPVAITLKGSDADGDNLTYTYEQPANGVAEGSPPFLTYTPADGFAGATDMFTYTVSDDKAESIGTVQIEVSELRYRGTIAVLSKPPLPVYELSAGNVELIVANGSVSAVVEFTLVAVLKWRGQTHLCTATMHRLYKGQGALAKPLKIELVLVDSANELEGPDCEGVVPTVVKTQVLEGAFSDDGETFKGNIRNAWEITAGRVN